MIKSSHLSGIIKTAPSENGLQKLFSSWSSVSLNFVSWCLKMDPQSRPTSEELLKHKLFTYDDFANNFLRKLRQKVIMEFNENPLLRHVRDRVISSTDRISRRDELNKPKKLSQTSETLSKQNLEPHKWQIKVGEAVKRKLSNDTINSCDNISTSDRNLNALRTNQKRSFQSIQSKESSLQTMIKEKISQEFASTQKLNQNFVLPPTTQKRRSDIENLQKPSGSVTKLNQKSDILRPASVQKEETDPSSPPRFQSLQSNLSDFKSPSRASLNSQNILHPSISNICFCKEPIKQKSILQTIQNTSIRNTFHQLPLANPPRGQYIRKIDKGLYCEPPIIIPDSINQNSNVDMNFLNKMKKKEKPKYDEFTLPTCPGGK